MAAFHDFFSKQSDIYAKYRPTYPADLFTYLSSLTEQHTCAWDCGTGNGQAAVSLASYYEKVIASDPSEQQISNAIPHKKIQYLVEKAENNSIASGSIDITTVANAMHWFNFESFYKEVHRVLKRNGVLAAWAYGLPQISPQVDKIVKHLHDDILGNYWREPNRMVEKEYSTVPFPFSPIETPTFYMEKTMTVEDIIGYLNTWSATQRFIDENKQNPVKSLENELKLAWGKMDEVKRLRWKLILKVGRVNT